MLHGSHSRNMQGSTVSDLSNDSSPTQDYPDFPPSPDDSWLRSDNVNTTSNQNSSAAVGHYWYSYLN